MADETTDDVQKLNHLMKTDDKLNRDCSVIAMSLGLSFLPNPDKALELAPLRSTLIGRLFRRSKFEQVAGLTSLIHRLIFAICSKPQWLIDSLKDVCISDQFTARLCQIMSDVYLAENPKKFNEDVFALRTDYMTTENESRILQVEVNTISAGFANASEALGIFHKWIRNRASLTQANQPFSEPGSGLARGLAKAHGIFLERYNLATSTQVKILFIVEAKERNEIDQRLLEISLLKNHGISIDRMTLEEVSDRCKINDNSFLVNDHCCYSLVYFRSGYGPAHYQSEKDWKARELIERSASMKCPSIPGQLAGTKKVQQLWFTSGPGLLGELGLSETEISQLMKVFAIQADPVDEPEIVKRAIENPHAWVLKPQREGGGNNIYKEKVKEALISMSPTELKQYVLMERMQPERRQALVARGNLDGSALLTELIDDSICELGIFSMFIPNHLDECTGHLIRTKDCHIDEGGVNAGFSFLDTACLVD